MITSTEEDYLKALFNIAQNERKEMVGTNQIAQKMDTSAASVTDMLRKLNAKDLIIYEKYKGAKLSSLGTAQAMILLRKHRLWESFLVDKLGFAWDEVHDLAEQLEHVRSPELVNKLDEYLGYPKFDPHGDPIPCPDGNLPDTPNTALAEVELIVNPFTEIGPIEIARVCEGNHLYVIDPDNPPNPLPNNDDYVYYWYLDGELVATIVGVPYYSPSEEGVYTVEVLNANGTECSSLSSASSPFEINEIIDCTDCD